MKEIFRDPNNPFSEAFTIQQVHSVHKFSWTFNGNRIKNDNKILILNALQNHFIFFYYRKIAFYLQIYLKMNIMENKEFVAGKWIEMEKLIKVLNLLWLFEILKLNWKLKKKNFWILFWFDDRKFSDIFFYKSFNKYYSIKHTRIDLKPTMGAFIDSI